VVAQLNQLSPAGQLGHSADEYVSNP